MVPERTRKNGDRDLLEIYDSLPDLLAMARERVSQDEAPYPVQEELQRSHEDEGIPYRFSMPHRHRVTCSTGEHSFGAVKVDLVDPRGKGLFSRKRRVTLWKRTVHEVRFHDGTFPEEVADFLRSL